MGQPQHKDSDGDGDDPGGVEHRDLPTDEGDHEFLYPFVSDADAKLRCFIAKHYVHAEIDAVILVQNMERIFKWIKDGTVPRKPQLVGKE